MKKKEKALILLLFSILFFILNFTPQLTGKVILGYNKNFSVFTILGLAFLIASFIIFVSKKTLDVIIIPTGSPKADIERAERAFKEKERLSKEGYFLISGYSQKELKPEERQVYQIYKKLRSKGVTPKKMGLEGKARDTRENVIYSLKKIEERAKKKGHKGPIRVGVVSYPGHLKRFEDFYNTAIKEGLAKEGEFEFEKIKTSETAKERRYEKFPLRRARHWYKLLTMGKYKK
jgi:uncharacterized SAM-binding protein YcdF (DUF218 family)